MKEVQQNKNLPLVSVSVMCYNQKHFLKPCFDALLAQTYKNIQIVVGDDASSDGSQELLKIYKKKYPKIFKLVLNKKNLGITENSQSVLENCDGEYIAITAADDLFMPKKIEKQVNFMEKNTEATMCYHNVEVFDSKTNQKLFLFNDKEKGLYPYQGHITKQLFERRCFIGATSVMVKKSAVIKDGFDSRIKYESDYQLFIDASAKGETLYINEVLARYRRHEGNNTTKTKFYYDDGLITYDIMEEKYPEFKKSINKGRAYYYLIIIFKSLQSLQTCDLLKYTGEILSLLIFKPYTIPFLSKTIYKSIKKKFTTCSV